MNPEVLRRKAKSQEVPSRKAGKRWIFIKEHLADWVSGRYPEHRQDLRVIDCGKKPTEEHSICQSTRGRHLEDAIHHNRRRAVQRSARTKIKQEAQELHDQLKAEAWRVKNLGSNPRYTWQEAVIRWLNEQSQKKVSEMIKNILGG